MLIDDVTITVKAGNGGNGAVSFRRNAQTPRGGPDGGNGGNGGDVYFEGIDDILGLREFQFKKKLMAEDGVAGARNNLYGRNAEDLTIKIPIGTKATDVNTGEVIEISQKGQRILIARGGKGGRGNNEFKSATVQAPRFAEKGTPGEERVFHLELGIIADIGLVGLPNAGKSSLLSVITNANPKIGDYPFTTLEPNLGVLNHLIIADIPGLIEGASKGKGLGDKFLKHVEKTKELVHCIDASEDISKVYKTVKEELKTYSEELSKKPELLLITKTDNLDEKQLKEKIKEAKKLNKNVETISIYDDDSIEKFKKILVDKTLAQL